MTSIIQTDETIDQMYARLLITMREIDRGVRNKTAVCDHCNCTLERHLLHERCSVYSTSRVFRDKRHDEHTKIMRAIEYIEELKKL